MDKFVKVANLSDVQENSLFPVEADEEPVCLTKIDGII
jgi:hypothetical protein